MDFAKTPSTAVSKPIKALLCVLLSFVLVLGFVPVSPAYADATENPAEQGDNANSFRYSDGQLSDEVTTLSESSSWTSSYGDAAYKGASGKKVKVPASQAVGIDVSHHNGTINWVKVRNQGIDFAIIRIGYC